MSWNPNQIFYACIAKDTTILAEFNSKDADLGDLAHKCLQKTPPFHSVFSHTVHGETYMFFIHDPFVYFGIFDESLEKPECLLFLKSVRDSFTSMIHHSTSNMLKLRLNSPNYHCFQGEFSPVFHHLLASNLELDLMASPAVLKDARGDSLSSVRRKYKGATPLPRNSSLSEGLEMKKRYKEGLEEDKLDVLTDDEVTTVSSGGCRARHWKKHVMLVLSMDFIVCTCLFVIWLWVCNGFQCVAN